MPSIRRPMFNKFKIPVPPMPVQREIVHILDNFTELTQELMQELMLRKKQYEYYRDMLLNFDDNVELRTLGKYVYFSMVIEEKIILQLMNMLLTAFHL